MTHIRKKRFGTREYIYEDESYRGTDGKNHTRHVRYIGKSTGYTGFVSKGGTITDKPLSQSVGFKKKGKKIIVNSEINNRQEETLRKIYKHYDIVMPKRKEDLVKRPYFIYNPSTGVRESFYNREDAEERAISIKEQMGIDYAPNINKEQ